MVAAAVNLEIEPPRLAAGTLPGMCGRFTQMLTWREVIDLYGPLDHPAVDVPWRYNGAPTQHFAACRNATRPSHYEREAALLQWGLIPRWAKDRRIGSRLINARAETVHEKPAFRSAFRSRRCLVPASNWFEWRAVPGGKQPWLIRTEGGPVSFAAIWETWERDGKPVESFAILTTAAAPTLTHLHHRQPAIVRATDHGEWLDPGAPLDRLLQIAREPFGGPFEWFSVSRQLNNPGNDSPQVLAPLEGPSRR